MAAELGVEGQEGGAVGGRSQGTGAGQGARGGAQETGATGEDSQRRCDLDGSGRLLLLCANRSKTRLAHNQTVLRVLDR